MFEKINATSEQCCRLTWYDKKLTKAEHKRP